MAIFGWILILSILFLLGGGIFYGYSLIKNSFSEEIGIEQTAISGIGETSQIFRCTSSCHVNVV